MLIETGLARAFAQRTGYITSENVAVLWFRNDDVARSVAGYYADKRNIPADLLYEVPYDWSLDTCPVGSGNIPMIDENDLVTIANWWASTIKASTRNIMAVVTVGNWPDMPTGSQGAGGVPMTVSAMLMNPFAFLATDRADWGNYLAIVHGTTAEAMKYWEDWKDTGSNYVEPSSGNGGLDHYPLLCFPNPSEGTRAKSAPESDGSWASIFHFRIEIGEVDPADPRRSSKEDYMKRIIDDAIAVEKERRETTGNMYLGYSSSVDRLVSPAFAMSQLPFSNTYWENLHNDTVAMNQSAAVWENHYYHESGGELVHCNRGDAGPLGSGYFVPDEPPPTVDTSHVGAATPWLVNGAGDHVDMIYHGTWPKDNFPPGCDTIINRSGKTFLPQKDVFFRAIGSYSYFTNAEPDGVGEYEYRKGAIVVFSQSYGARPIGFSLDYDYGSHSPIAETIDVTPNIGGWNDNSVRLRIAGRGSSYLNHVEFRCDNAVTGARVIVTNSPDQLDFQEDTGSGYSSVGTISLTGTLRNWTTLILANLPTGWQARSADPWVQSRTDTALREGACVAIGAAHEPYSSGASNAHGLIMGLWSGGNLAEVMYTTAWSCMFHTQNAIVGDPLYRPFGHHLPKAHRVMAKIE